MSRPKTSSQTKSPASARSSAPANRTTNAATVAVDGDAIGMLSIGDLADEFGITTRTIRFYEARGLISPARAGANRIYSRRDRARLQLILRGKNLGFSIEDIAEYLSLYDTDPAQRLQTRLLLDKLEARIADLVQKRTDLERTLRELDAIREQCVGHLKSR